MSYFGVSLRNGVGLGLGTVPSLTNTPLSYRLAPSLNLSFAGSDSLSPAITFSRTTNATLTNSAGLVAYAPMNLLTYSEQFDNAAWSVARCTITANTAIAPDGSTTADTLVEDTTSNSHPVFRTITGFTTTAYTGSCYIKANVRTQARIAFASTAFAASPYVDFNLSAVTANGANGATGTITSVGNGWYRCTATATAGAAGNGDMYIQPLLAGAPSYLGTGANALYLWGAQLELGSTASTYNSTTVKNLLGYTENFDNAAWTKSNSFVQTNLLTYSQDFDNAAWAKSAATVTANASVAPDGTTTADSITASSANGGAYQGVSVTTGGVYTWSVYAKAGTGSSFRIKAQATATVAQFVFDLTAVTATLTAGAGTATITPAGNGWYRCTVTATATLTGTGYHEIDVTNSGEMLYIWGAQLVQGASAGDYKATYAAAAPGGYTDIYGQPFAQKLVANTTSTTHFVQIPTTTVANTVYTSSVYLKEGGYSFATVYVVGANVGRYFDLSTGTVGNVFVAAPLSSSITPIGNGWYRCSITYTATAASDVRVYVNETQASTFAGDGTSGIYIFGAQLSDSASVDPYVYQPVAAPSSVAYYGPRFDYDPVTLQPKGLLIEEQRTNLVLNSSILNTQIVTVTAAAHTLSFYGTGTIVLSGAYTGTLVGTGAYPTRTTLTFTPIVGALTLTVTGSVTMAQLEAGAFATSYIPTVASQVTRAADSASMIGNNFARWYNVNAGSLFIQFQLISGNVAGNNANIVAFEGAAGANMTLHRDSAAGWRYRTNLANLNVTGVFDVASNKTVFAYATSDYPFDAAGGAVQLNTGVGAPPVTTSLLIGAGSNYAAAKPINGTISRIAYYPKRLSNTELQGITA